MRQICEARGVGQTGSGMAWISVSVFDIRYEESSCPSSRGWFGAATAGRRRGGRASASNIPMGITPPLRGSRRSPQASRWGGLRLNPKQSERAAKAVLKHHEANHSPLEGESARPGRSPPSSRWGEMKRAYTRQTLERAEPRRLYGCAGGGVAGVGWPPTASAVAWRLGFCDSPSRGE